MLSPIRTARPSSLRSSRSARWSETAAATASAASANTETVESPSPIGLISSPPCASIVAATSWSCQTRARAIASGCWSQSGVEPSMSVKQKVRTPVGSDIRREYLAVAQ